MDRMDGCGSYVRCMCDVCDCEQSMLVELRIGACVVRVDLICAVSV